MGNPATWGHAAYKCRGSAWLKAGCPHPAVRRGGAPRGGRLPTELGIAAWLGSGVAKKPTDRDAGRLPFASGRRICDVQMQTGVEGIVFKGSFAIARRICDVRLQMEGTGKSGTFLETDRLERPLPVEYLALEVGGFGLAQEGNLLQPEAQGLPMDEGDDAQGDQRIPQREPHQFAVG
jgi:hypothetical protein